MFDVSSQNLLKAAKRPSVASQILITAKVYDVALTAYPFVELLIELIVVGVVATNICVVTAAQSAWQALEISSMGKGANCEAGALIASVR